MCVSTQVSSLQHFNSLDCMWVLTSLGLGCLTDNFAASINQENTSSSSLRLRFLSPSTFTHSIFHAISHCLAI